MQEQIQPDLTWTFHQLIPGLRDGIKLLYKNVDMQGSPITSFEHFRLATEWLRARIRELQPELAELVDNQILGPYYLKVESDHDAARIYAARQVRWLDKLDSDIEQDVWV